MRPEGVRRFKLYNFFTLWYNYNGIKDSLFLYIAGGEARRFTVYFRPDLRYDIIGGVLLLKNLKDFNLLNYMKINLKGDYYLWDIMFHFL
jgi:hypothetical protein